MLIGKLSNIQIYFIDLDENNNNNIKKFKKIGYNNIEQISVIKYPRYESHIYALQKAINLNLEYVLICEDNNIFTDLLLINKQLKYLFNSKIYFDVLVMGSNVYNSIRMNDNISRIIDGYSLTYYIVHKHYYKKLLDIFINECNYLQNIKKLIKNDQWIYFSVFKLINHNKLHFNNNTILYIKISAGFGNNLLMVLNGLALQKKYNCNLYFISNYKDTRPNITTYQIFGRLNYITMKNINNINLIKEKRFMYDEIILKNMNKKYIISGYYQSYKYFNNDIDIYKHILFENIPNIVEEMGEKYNVLKNGKTTVLIHFRLGDYVKAQQYFPVQTHEYYKNAISTFDGDYRYLIFSDNLELVKKYDYIENLSDKVFIEETDIEKTFVLMSLCDNFIISNSSFSLCAYYFRNVKQARIVAPLKWFGISGPKFDLNDLIPDTEYRLLL